MASNTVESEAIEDILHLWFSEITKPLWFRSTEEFDQQLLARFSTAYDKALHGEYDEWKNTAPSCLALVILLDQFPLNMYRGQALSFAGENKAVAMCQYGIQQEYDKAFTDEEKMFLYMPLMHSENMQHQNQCVDLFERAGLEENARFAKHHRRLIEKYGRFPHRNQILGRENSVEEQAYLASKEAFLG